MNSEEHMPAAGSACPSTLPIAIRTSARWLNGLNPIIREAEEELQRIGFFSRDDVEKKLFLEASIMVLKSIIRLAGRYADAAERLAENEKDPSRKAELERIAEACRWVPANSPKSFYQAMQSLWFNQILVHAYFDS